MWDYGWGGAVVRLLGACDSEALVFEAFVIVGRYAAVRRLEKSLANKRWRVGRSDDLGKAWWNYTWGAARPLSPRFPAGASFRASRHCLLMMLVSTY